MSWRNRIFGKRRPSALELLNGASWTCRSCHEQHRGMFDLAADSPDQWDQPETVEPNSALRFHGNFLSEDLCVLDGEHFFVRCVFEIPTTSSPSPRTRASRLNACSSYTPPTATAR
jgi:hypothetical protein